MARLCSIPNELLVEILRLVDQPDVERASRTCRKLHCLSMPLLYSSLNWHFNSNESFAGDPEPPIHLYFRTIWRRPDFAALVKKATFHSLPDNSRCDDTLYIPPDQEARQCWIDAFRQLDMDMWMDEIHVGSVSALIPILLTRLPNLGLLDIDFSIIRTSPLLGVAILRLTSNPAPPAFSQFRRLREVHIRNDRDSRIINEHPSVVNTGLALFALPCVENLEVVLREPVLEDLPWQPEWQSELPTFPSIKKLRVLHCSTGAEVLLDMLDATPNLETLEYHLALDIEQISSHGFDLSQNDNAWARVARALNKIRDTLRNLTITVDYACVKDSRPGRMPNAWSTRECERRGNLEPLTFLSRLERLELPISVLLGWKPDFSRKRLQNFLPTTLRELCLRDDFVELGCEWAPWDEDVPSRQSFQSTCKPAAILHQLWDYLVHSPVSLALLCIKAQKDRLWHPRDLECLEDIVREARTACVVQMRMHGHVQRRIELSEPSDRVMEMVIYDPRDLDWQNAKTDVLPKRLGYKFRFFDEPAKTFWNKVRRY